ncbi:MAG: V-type ATP synthase subunit E [Haloarculaceae archaeon]
MSLDTVVEDILDEARARANEIEESAEEEAAEIVDEAEADATEIVDEAERDVEREIAQEREQTLSSAKLEAKQMRLEARRDVLGEVRETAAQRIADLEGERRETLTRALLEDATAEFDGDATVEVYGRAGDQDLLEEILADYDGYEYAGERDCLGGVVVESDASRIRVNNTFDSILDDVWEEHLSEISDRLFEQ